MDDFADFTTHFSEAKHDNPFTLLNIGDLVPFANHPFKLYDGKRLDDMVRSVKELGVLVPIIVRAKKDYVYEVLSGHNRINAAKLAGLTEIPAIVKEGLADEDATLIVTETNLVQRSFADLAFSERAIALKHHMDAIKRQGKRNDLVEEIERLSSPNEGDEGETLGIIVPKMKSRDKLAEKYGLNARSVSRYIRLNFLIQPLLNRVDNGEIGLYPAVSISYLNKNEQAVLESILAKSFRIDMKKAEALRGLSKVGELTPETIEKALSNGIDQENERKAQPSVTIKTDIIKKYFKSGTKQSEIEAVIAQALAEYFKKHK